MKLGMQSLSWGGGGGGGLWLEIPESRIGCESVVFVQLAIFPVAKSDRLAFGFFQTPLFAFSFRLHCQLTNHSSVCHFDFMFHLFKSNRSEIQKKLWNFQNCIDSRSLKCSGLIWCHFSLARSHQTSFLQWNFGLLRNEFVQVIFHFIPGRPDQMSFWSGTVGPDVMQVFDFNQGDVKLVKLIQKLGRASPHKRRNRRRVKKSG